MAVTTGWAKPTGRLADYANASKGTLLVGEIQAHMIKEAAKPSNRRQDIIHPSEMAKTGWCPLSTYLRITACREAANPYLKAPEFIGVQLLNIFDEGHMIHDKWQKRLRDMGELWGNWACSFCSYEIKGELYPGKWCSCCEGGSLIYREVPLQAPQYLIYGHADGAVPSKNALIEIKSVGAGTVRIEAPDIYSANSEGQKIDLQGLWKDIKEPFPSHMRQGQLYLHLCALMGLPYTQIVFIYESKFNQGVKEFVVKYDPEFCTEMMEACETIRDAFTGVGSPPKCPTGTCKDCERYGAQKSDIVRMGESSEPTGPEGADSTGTPLRRTSPSTNRIVRPSRQESDGTVPRSSGMVRVR